jgi:biopolymer transport protein ExbB/TolQ
MTLPLPQSFNLGDWLQFFSTLSTPLIVLCALLHLAFFALLRFWCRRDLRILTQTLQDFTRPLHHRSVLDHADSLPAQIEAFILDVQEVLSNPALHTQRSLLLERICILDEKRRYLDSLRFDTAWNAARSMIEAYPLSGILGTILAIGSALHTESVTTAATAASSIATPVASSITANSDSTALNLPPVPAAPTAAASVSLVMDRFGDSIWSSFAGLLAAIILMFTSSLSEVRFGRLSECRTSVRQLVATARRELQLSTMPAATSPEPLA